MMTITATTRIGDEEAEDVERRERVGRRACEGENAKTPYQKRAMN